MGFRFLHLADVHLETCFGGLPGSRQRLRQATLEAFERAADLALDRDLHAVLVAGDLFDDSLLSLRTEAFLVHQVRRLAESGVWFLYACGNHDPGSQGLRAARLGLEAQAGEEASWRERVRVFRSPEPEAVTVTDRQGRPVGVVVGAGHRGSAEADNLAARFGPIPSAVPVVGLLHTYVLSARAAEDHDRYAPSTDADYRRLDYSYWALGHVHARQRAVPDLPVFYAGNLQGRNARETGQKGGLLVEAHPRVPAEPEFVRLAPVRWERVRVDDLPDDDSAASLLDHVAARIAALRSEPADELAIRVDLTGPTPLARALRDPGELELLGGELAERTGALEVRVCAAGVRLPVDEGVLRAAPTVLATALELMERAATDDALLDALAPDSLAADLHGRQGRTEYLRELLADLPQEAIVRSVHGEPT